MGTGAVSRYKLSRSQKPVTVQDFNWGQMRVSGCNNHYKFVLSAGVKAKSVTNNLPILSVLAVRGIFLSGYEISIVVIKSKYFKVMDRISHLFLDWMLSKSWFLK